ncbi:MAG: hypothetical protein JW913_08140 [Chitinispirillaceae bacterium]|nr:hypothetical protein [Chitinispirillaceae bacterium]
MKCCFMFIAALVCAVTGQDLVLSKDSLWILNNYNSSRFGDSVTITNNGSQPILLDSARIQFSEWYTIKPSFTAANAQAVIYEYNHGQSMSHYFTVDSIDATEYRLDFSSSSRPIFSVGPDGDSIILIHMEIGVNFFGAVPIHPQYLKGLLRLYFSNGEAVKIRIYSDDLRPTIVKKTFPVCRRTLISGNDARYLINGRKITRDAAGVNLNRIRYRLYELRIKE